MEREMNMTFNFGLEEILSELKITRNKLAVEAKVRPVTVNDLFDGKSKRIELPTIQKILDSLNQFAEIKGLDKTYTIDDIIKYEYKENDPE
jgi:DNA-binding Xre family transcriptional regulator